MVRSRDSFLMASKWLKVIERAPSRILTAYSSRKGDCFCTWIRISVLVDVSVSSFPVEIACERRMSAVRAWKRMRSVHQWCLTVCVGPSWCVARDWIPMQPAIIQQWRWAWFLRFIDGDLWAEFDVLWELCCWCNGSSYAPEGGNTFGVFSFTIYSAT